MMGEVFDAAHPDALLLDCSTIDVLTAKSVASAAAERGLAMVDAPVSGGIAAANAGTLTFMVGGPDDAFDRAKTILEGMGKVVIHAGAARAGQAAKICNNMLLGASMVATAEAFVLAKNSASTPRPSSTSARKPAASAGRRRATAPSPDRSPPRRRTAITKAGSLRR